MRAADWPLRRLFLVECPGNPPGLAADSAHTRGMAEQRESAGVRQRRGQAAEELAAAYLERRGLKLLARNVRCKLGELDLVCLDGALLVIVEVRQRTRCDFGGALASITGRKRLKIIRTAHYMLQCSPALRRRRVRFDVLGLEGKPDGAPRMIWIKDAFRAT